MLVFPQLVKPIEKKKKFGPRDTTWSLYGTENFQIRRLYRGDRIFHEFLYGATVS